MKTQSLFLLLAILAITSLACGVTFNLPVTELKTGPTVTDELRVAVPDTSDDLLDLSISFGAGELVLKPGAEDLLLQGMVVYNVEDLKPSVSLDGNSVKVESGDLEINAIPNFGDDFINRWDLLVGDVPINLHIVAGAYAGKFEFGGLALQSLEIKDGAADVDLSFSTPNRIEMDTLRYETGASDVTLRGLANANFTQMVFKGGAGSYTLDFSGELARSADVKVDAGLSSVTIIIPRGMAARVFVDGGLSNVDVGGEWEKSGNEYTLAGEGQRLTINVNIGAGSLDLRNQ